ncbi:MAG TPA: hypothetical protein VIJ31_09735 [Acidothermaceae bacterium]
MNDPTPPLVIAELSTARLVLRPLDPPHDAADLFDPQIRPWGRRDFTFALPEAHRIGVSGATTPTNWARA